MISSYEEHTAISVVAVRRKTSRILDKKTGNLSQTCIQLEHIIG
jgi:hypothetical protein